MFVIELDNPLGGKCWLEGMIHDAVDATTNRNEAQQFETAGDALTVADCLPREWNPVVLRLTET